MTATVNGTTARAATAETSLESSAHQALVTWLTETHPQPGTPVPIREFARVLGMSRTPVRSAVSRLHERGLLSYDPSVGFTVAVPSPTSLYELFDLRLMIESHSLRRFTEQETYRAPAALHDLVTEASDLADRVVDDPDQYMAFRDNDSRFHKMLVQMSGLPRLIALHEELDLSIHVTRAGREAPLNRQRLDSSVAEHQAVVDALDRGDAVGAREALESHILRVRDQTIVFLSRPRPVSL
ncbi:GntR family transcriptional regulator [Pseudactinotalea terrae]|uniref:GntR family transcriptional regulator n=1 Tax=Pseudactinotalea terrae TaxID=1743262 RepID=UPI0012E1259E|nr:GntR family transcriptional regulator [Pseudactinotalea terrae]